MVIKSIYKDYYDYVAHQYGGGDPKIAYARNRIAPMTDYGSESTVKVEMDGRFPIYRIQDIVPYEDRDKREAAYLIVAGKPYLLTKGNTLSRDVNDFRIQPLNYFEEYEKKRSRRWWMRHENMELGKEYPFFVELSRKIQAPVFVILYSDRRFNSDKIEVTVSGQCPILEKIGMPAFVPAPQMYQEIAYFVGNTMKEHPDTEPPVEVSNNCKIVNAGFDLKQSFRHRM